MKTIELSQGKSAKVDDEDFEWLSSFSWYFDGRYAHGYVNRKKVRMHTLLAKTPVGMQTDHVNGDKLDNRMSNLRVCSRSENIHNKPAALKNTSGYRGVCWDKERGKWMAYLNWQGRRKTLGRFDSKEEAALAYNQGLDRYFPNSRWKNLV